MLKFFAGFLAILFGLWLVLFTFAVASMVDPHLQGHNWWSEVFMNYRSHGEAKEVTIIGLMLMVGGASLCVRIWRRGSLV